MTVDLCDKPFIEELLEKAHLQAAIKEDAAKHKRATRMIIESDYINHMAGGNWHKLLEMFSVGSQKRMTEIENQEQYDVIFKDFYDLCCIANTFIDDMRIYCKLVDDRIKEIITCEFVCPCCGREINDEFVDNLRRDRDYREDLVNFYTDFRELLYLKLKALRQLAKEKKYDQRNWQKDLKPTMGSRARVEEIEGEKTAVQKALEKNAARRKAGFKFWGE